jgi:hypothetical protein
MTLPRPASSFLVGVPRVRAVLFGAGLALGAGAFALACTQEVTLDPLPEPVVDASTPTSDGFVDLDPDGGDARTGSDASSAQVAASVNDFLTRQATAFCGALKTACGAPAAWQAGKCSSTYLAGFSNLFEDLQVPGVAGGGRIIFSKSESDACVQKIGTVPLPTRTAAQQAAIVDACRNVVVGTQQLGKPCAANIECVPGNACKRITNGVGTCASLDVEGASCEYPTSLRVRSNTCSYHGNGETGLFCSNTDNVSGKCMKFQANGTACSFDTQCASNLCAPNADFTAATCVDSYNELTANGTCAYFTSP